MILGIAGKMGTGKTTLSKQLQACEQFRVGENYFSLKNATIIEADQIVHDLMRLKEVKSQIITQFGEGVIENGEISRSKLGDIVFESWPKMQMLTDILHPLAQNQLIEQVNKIRSQSKNAIVVAALPWSLRMEAVCDQILILSVHQDMAWQRVRKRNPELRQERFDRIWARQAKEYDHLAGCKNALEQQVFVAEKAVALAKCLPKRA